jgi:putative aldouronate transport system substrate-binding protein
MKKFLALVLAVIMVLSLCTACGKEAGNNEAVTLTWYIPQDKQADLALINAEASKITMEKIGVNLDIQFIDTGSFQERMNMNMASGQDYDLTFVGYINKFDNAAARGGLMALDELIKDTPKIQEIIPQYIMDSGYYKGQLFAIPNMQITASALAMIFKKDLVEKYNFDVSAVEETGDAEPFFEMIAKNEKNIYPVRMHVYGTAGIRSRHQNEAPVGSLYYVEGNSVATHASAVKDAATKSFKVIRDPVPEETKIKAKKIHEYFKKGYIRQDVASVMDDTAELQQGRYAVDFGTYLPGIEGQVEAARGYAVEAARITPIALGSAVATMTGIGRNCKHPEEAMKVIELANSDPEFYNLLSYGIEGKHYKKVAEKRIELIPDSGYNSGGAWKFGNQFNGYVLPGQEDDVWEETIALNDQAYHDSLSNPSLLNLGFVFDDTNIRTISTKIAEVNNKYKCKHNGSKDPETYWDTYRAEVIAAGWDTYCDELQKQIDAFCKENPEKMATVQW